MVNIVVFDIEHTGCSNQKILQVSWRIYKNDKLYRVYDYYRNYKRIDINPIVYNKIKNSIRFKTFNNSASIRNILDYFCRDIEKADILVSHNIKCDINIINKEVSRNRKRKIIYPKLFCTMTNTKHFCNLKNKIGIIKNPKLEELYSILFSVNNLYCLHNSLCDTFLCAECYFKYKKMINKELNKQ